MTAIKSHIRFSLFFIIAVLCEWPFVHLMLTGEYLFLTLPTSFLLGTHLFAAIAAFFSISRYQKINDTSTPWARNFFFLVFFLPFFGPDELIKRKVEGVQPWHLSQVLEAVEEAAPALGRVQTEHPEAEIWQREFTWLIEMLRFACRLGIERLGSRETPPKELARHLAEVQDGFAEVWRFRSREGGLKDSATRLSQLRSWF